MANPRFRRLKRALIVFAVVTVLFSGCGLLLSTFTHSAGQKTILPFGTLSDNPYPDGDAFTVMTVNLAHGRGNGRHQALRFESSIRQNLEAVATVVKREDPHIVALQEADAPSVWSGGFNHVIFIADSCRMQSVQSTHVDGCGLHYGTALLSRFPLENAMQCTFKPTWPTFSKGFTYGEAVVGNRRVGLISVHLDFRPGKGKARKQQLEEIIEFVQDKSLPLIVAGDFNCEWSEKEDSLRTFAQRLKLQAWQPENEDLVTFRKLKSRIDYILISQELAFVSHHVLDDVISDHRTVKAVVRFRDEQPADLPKEATHQTR